MRKDLMSSLSLYPIKYLIDFFEPYGSSLETNILLTSKFICLKGFFVFVEFTLLVFFSSKFMLFPLNLIMIKKK